MLLINIIIFYKLINIIINCINSYIYSYNKHFYVLIYLNWNISDLFDTKYFIFN